MSEYLPEEVLIDIFLRLPINSILRCTCVCKSWYSLLTSSTFVSTHLNQAQDDHILVSYCSFYYQKEIYSLFHDNQNFDRYAKFVSKFEYCRVVGSCNGILCLADDEDVHYTNFYLWNPSIRKSVKIPEPIGVVDTHGYYCHTLGFGYDHVTNDYKVVRVVHLNYDSMPPNVELYKLSTGVWQDISRVAPFYLFDSLAPQVYVNGASHWIASKKRGGERQSVIALFDMHDETFRELMLPGSLGNQFEGVLRVSDESLCLFDSWSGDDKLDVWMMKKYGEPESWAKQFSISSRTFECNSAYWITTDEFLLDSFTCYLEKPMAIRKNGEIVWRSKDGLLVSYDHASVEKVKDLGVFYYSDRYGRDSLYVNTFKESLVLLDKQKKIVDRETCEQSSDLCKRELKSGRKKFLKAKTKRRLRIAYSLHISGLLYMSKM